MSPGTRGQPSRPRTPPSPTPSWPTRSCPATRRSVSPYTTVGILPKHILESATGATIADSAFNQAPAGTGPYRLAQLDQTKAILRANPTYYGAKPVIDEVEVRFYPD